MKKKDILLILRTLFVFLLLSYVIFTGLETLEVLLESLENKKVPEIKPLGALPECYVGGCKHQVLT